MRFTLILVGGMFFLAIADFLISFIAIISYTLVISNISTGLAELLAEFPWDCVYIQGATYYKGILYVTCNSATTSTASNYKGITVKAIRTDIWELFDSLKVNGSFEPEGLDVVALGNTSSLTYEIMMGMGKSGVMSQAVRFSIPYEL